MTDAYLEQGQRIAEQLSPGLRDALSAKYDAMLPGMADSLIAWAYGQHYARPALDLKTRQLCTVAALTALGGQTAPQLKVNIAHTLAAGASAPEILEAIWQMSVYGGMPAAINGLNAAAEVFAERGITPGQG